MGLVEIRTGEGILLLARPGRLPAVAIRSGDRQSLQARLRRLPAEVAAIGRVRRKWRALGMTVSASTMDDGELAAALRRKVSSGQLDAVFLRDAPLPSAPPPEQTPTPPVLHVQLPGMTVLIAGKGMLPPEFHGQSDPLKAAEIIRQIGHGTAQAKAIDTHAHRLPGGTTNTTTGAPLRQHIVHQLERGGHDAVVITNPAVIAQAAARPEAPKSVAQMSQNERIEAALKASLPYAAKAGGEAIRKALDDLLQPANIATMIAMAAGVALANLHPISAVVVDAALLGLAWWYGGNEAIAAVTDFAMATLDARDATSDEELDKAAQAYGKALGAMGPKLLSKIVNRFGKKGGGKKGGKGAGKNNAVPQGGKGSSNGTRGNSATGASPSKAANATKSAVKFGKKRNYTEPGAVKANQANLKAALQAKYRYKNGAAVPQKDGWAKIPASEAATFAKNPEAIVLKPGEKIYRVIDSERGKGGSYWTTVDPRTVNEGQWRAGNAVRGDWNGDGAFVEYTIPKEPKEGLRVWSGTSAAQRSSDEASILEGGANQLWMPKDTISPGEPISTGWGG